MGSGAKTCYASVYTLTGFETRLLLLKVLWCQDLQQRVEEGHIGQLADQDQRLRGKKRKSVLGQELKKLLVALNVTIF